MNNSAGEPQHQFESYSAPLLCFYLKWLSVIVVSIGSDKQMWSKIVPSWNKEICQLIISLYHTWAPHVEWFRDIVSCLCFK